MQTIDAFFTTVTDEELKDEVRRVVFWFIGLAAATLVGSFLEVSMFMWAGARQVSRLRTRYLRACLGQEQAYYDTEATSGHVLSGLNEDCQAVQNAISEKVGNALHHLGAFVVAIGIGFWRGWRLTLVMLALSPLLVVAGGILAKIVGMGEARLAKSYAAASVQTNQAFGNMRTIASFQAEESTFDKYAAILAAPTKTQQRISTASGLAGGFINTALFVTCAFAARPSRASACAAWFAPMWVHLQVRLRVSLCGAPHARQYRLRPRRRRLLHLGPRHDGHLLGGHWHVLAGPSLAELACVCNRQGGRGPHLQRHRPRAPYRPRRRRCCAGAAPCGALLPHKRIRSTHAHLCSACAPSVGTCDTRVTASV